MRLNLGSQCISNDRAGKLYEAENFAPLCNHVAHRDRPQDLSSLKRFIQPKFLRASSTERFSKSAMDFHLSAISTMRINKFANQSVYGRNRKNWHSNREM